MNILTLSNCPLKESQGSGYVILNFCHGLRARGHMVDLFGPEHFEPLAATKKAKRYRQAAGMLYCAGRQLARKRYDVVEFYGSESCLAAMALARLPGRSFVLVHHSNGLDTHCEAQMVKHLGSNTLGGAPLLWYQSLRVLPVEKAFTCVDGIVTVSEYDRRHAVAQGYQQEGRVEAIDNALPEGYLHQPLVLERSPVIGYCGSWLPRKGTRFLISDVPRILTEFPAYIFRLIGVGERFRKEDHFPAAVLPRIEVVPFVEEKEKLRKLYESLAILVVPSVYESFGLVTAEGMACGCAVVATPTGFAWGLQNRSEALLLDLPTEGALYEGVKELIGNEPLRRRIAKAGYDRVQGLRWDSAITRLETCLLRWRKECRKPGESRRAASS